MKQLMPLALVTVFGTAISFLAFFFVREAEMQRVEREFDVRAHSQLQAMQMKAQGYADSLYALRTFVASSEGVTPEEFRRAASEIIGRHPGLEQLQWFPMVTRENRAEFEGSGVGLLTGTLEITERSGENSVRAADRERYLPRLFVEPKASDGSSPLGEDQLAGPHRAIILHATESRSLESAPIQLQPTGSDRDLEWLMLLPVYDESADLSTAASRQKHLRGIVEGAFRLTNLLETNTEPASAEVQMLFVDGIPGTNEPYVLSYANGHWKIGSAPQLADFKADNYGALQLRLGSNPSTVYFRPAKRWIAGKSSHYPFAFLAGGLVLTGLLAGLVNSVQRRTSTIERTVHERTGELKAVEERLREDIRQREQVEERYRAFLEQSSEAIWRYELDPPMPLTLSEDEQIHFLCEHAFMAECNDAVAKLYGYERSKEMIGARLSDLLPREEAVNTAHLRDYVRNQFRLSSSESHEFDRHGRLRVFLNNITGIIEEGHLVRAWGTQRDITEQRRVEEERRQNEARLRLAIAAADLGTWEWDLATKKFSWSEGTERIFGLVPGTFDGTFQTYLRLIHPADRERMEGVIRSAFRDGTELQHEHRIIWPDGTLHWVVIRGDELRDHTGRISRMLGAVMDVTEQRKAGEEKAAMERRLQESQKLESLGILAGGIAHDFNNLLTGVLGNASLARMDLAHDHPVQPCLEAIENVSQRAADLCKQMLAYSGKGRFVVQRINLSGLVEDTAHLINVSINKNAQLQFDLARNLPSISADATQMRQIVMNLVINASDAIGETQGVIRVRTGLMHANRDFLSKTYLAPDLPAGDYVYLEVSDNGCGMSPETKARIFDPFFTTKFTGRGLGLAAVLGIVRGHEGALTVDSEPGKGSTFRLLLPCEEGRAEDLPENPPDAPPWQGTGTVLVVDDEETVRLVTGRMLKSSGFDVIEASNGREALAKFREAHQIVAVLLDLTMPQMDGGETFSELLAIDPNVRVILMSGYNEQDAINRFASKGLAGFLQKPFKPDALRAKLRAMLEPENGLTEGTNRLSESRLGRGENDAPNYLRSQTARRRSSN